MSPTLVIAMDDAWVVSTAALAEVLQPWVDAYNVRHPKATTSIAGDSNSKWPTGYGAQKWLSKESGLTQARVGIILKCKTVVTSLAIAERLLIAAGLQHELHISVVPFMNPSWSQKTKDAYVRRHSGLHESTN